MVPTLQLKDIVRTYTMGDQQVRALAGVSLDIAKNEYVAIMGPSGSGKSTLMNIIGCLDKPNAGSYKLEGVSVDRMSEDELADIRNRKIGFVFQTFNLVPRVNVFKNVELPLIYAGLPSRAHHKPNELSGGQRQRVAIARALVCKPSIILADEPTGNLDSATGVEIMALLSELHRQGNTIILVTHEDDIAAHAQRVVRLRDGVIESDVRKAA